MPENKRPREHAIPIGGICLLFLGIVFLLQSLNILPWALWGSLWRFWPVLIIIAGLAILLQRYNVWLVSLLILALLLACLGIAIGQYEPSSPPGQSTPSYSEALDSLGRHTREAGLNTRLASLLLGCPGPEGTPDSKLHQPHR